MSARHRRGLSLGEGLISLALMLVVVTAVTVVASEMTRVSRFATRKDRALGLELRMLEVARECAQAREWIQPPPRVGASATRLEFRHVNPEQNHNPPLEGERLPATPPLPPAPDWNGFAPHWLRSVEYRYDPGSGQLLRLGEPVAPLAPGFRAEQLAAGLLQLDYAYRDEERLVQRRILVVQVLP